MSFVFKLVMSKIFEIVEFFVSKLKAEFVMSKLFMFELFVSKPFAPGLFVLKAVFSGATLPLPPRPCGAHLP